jgi:cathepsin A (carboxypeptidase C)
MIAPIRQKGLNLYDVRAPCKGHLCYEVDDLIAYLNTPQVQKELGMQRKWQVCDSNVTMAFVIAGDPMKNFHQFIPTMLGQGVEVLNFAGDTDYICNWIGNKEWALKMDWAHHDEFNAAADMDFLVDGVPAGRSRSVAGFTFTQIYNAGHMVPMDQPAAALAMLNRFIHQDALPPARSKFLAAGQNRLLK